MLFSSMSFIYVFLPIVCAIYLCVRQGLKNHVLLIASIIFYAWGEPSYLAIMLLTILINYIGANYISRSKKNTHRKEILALTIVLNLSFLFYFKYFNFVVENINGLFKSDIHFIKVIMPIGISFYTFQALSYLIDVYRGEVKVQRNIYKLALYICLFPQLIAGPIVKYRDVDEQISNRDVDFPKVVYGIKRFIIGLSKKMLLANTVGAIADKIFTQPVDQIDLPLSWLGAVSYTLQLYYDFSGYSDMAIGLGYIFGFQFLENFNYPFISKSISEYWRRWHISLGSWFRDYMFLPISRALSLSNSYSWLLQKIGRKKANYVLSFIALFVVWFCMGFWHGAAWTFIVYGLYNGFFIFIEILSGWNKNFKSLKIRFFQHIYTILVFICGLVIFRADTMTYACQYLMTMFGLKTNSVLLYQWLYYIDRIEVIAILTGIICATPVFSKMLYVDEKHKVLRSFINIWLIILFILSTSFIAASTYNPFIYFRF